VAQKVPFGVGTFIPSLIYSNPLTQSLDNVDPKTILCVYYKAGHCDKGNKCKFSHDMNINRKVEKKDLYSDTREDKENGTLFLIPSLDGDYRNGIHFMLTIRFAYIDTMDKWDEEKLRRVVTSKAGNPRTTTDIVCKYFIEAIETNKFGWFWECPNGTLITVPYSYFRPSTISVLLLLTPC
jgi:hypothetical protein